MTSRSRRPLPDADGAAGPDDARSLGRTLRQARALNGLSLRAVQARTDDAVTNGYLSQIETGAVASPSPNVLWHLAQVYGLDYGDLLVLAGHRIPRDQAPPDAQAVAGIPMSALADLTADERAELAEYVQFLRYRRNSGESRGSGR